jgi:hypothetical protein
MDMDQAAVFLAGSILTMLGFVVVIAGVIVINNLIHEFWKPVKLWRFEEHPSRFASQEELNRIAPVLDKKDSTK